MFKKEKEKDISRTCTSSQGHIIGYIWKLNFIMFLL